MLTAEAQYSINFSRSNKIFCLSLHYNGSNSFYLLVLQKNILIKSKRLWDKKYAFCLGNISGYFSANDMKKKKKKAGLNGCVYDFYVDCKGFDTSNIINIHKCLMKKH